jgi:Xaa-Pro aminopeptidase
MADAFRKPPAPRLVPKLRAILDTEFPRFSETEMGRRRDAVHQVMEQAEVSHLLLCGAGYRGSAVPWLTHWPVTTEVIAVLTPGEKDALYVQYFNHVPLAKRLAVDAEVNWGGAATIVSVAEELKRRGAAGKRIGVFGPLGFSQRDALADVCDDVINLNRDYVRLRLVKSDEELDWFRIGASLCDVAIDALADQLRSGLDEHDLADIVERSYTPWGARTGIHFFGVTSMHHPNMGVPAQFTSTRKIDKGDVVFTEISAIFGEYSGQVLRTFAVEEDPTPLYKDLIDTAQAAYEAIKAAARPGVRPEALIEAASVIEHAGFTTCDDLVHGYGGGYFPPIFGSKSRQNEPPPDMELRENMMMVIQPNVTTLDGKAGVQTGECVCITADGAVSMHDAPTGLIRV